MNLWSFDLILSLDQWIFPLFQLSLEISSSNQWFSISKLAVSFLGFALDAWKKNTYILPKGGERWWFNLLESEKNHQRKQIQVFSESHHSTTQPLSEIIKL